jgi:hypothetical protein
MENIDTKDRPRGREQLAAWYAQVLEAQGRSGLSIAEYGAQIGVTAATLYSWKRRLAPRSEGIFLVAGPTDMRKSFNGLSGIVRERLGGDPMSRDPFLFCNRNRNRLKVLKCSAMLPHINKTARSQVRWWRLLLASSPEVS